MNKYLKSVVVGAIQIILSVALLLILQPFFFEALRNATPTDTTTLLILVLGIILAAAASALVVFISYRVDFKRQITLIGVSFAFTLLTFTLISYTMLFTRNLWTYPWYQLLSLAVIAPNDFWVAWCAVSAVYSIVFSNLLKMEQSVID